MDFLLLIFLRAASGGQNALGYAGQQKWRFTISFALVAFLAMIGYGYIQSHADGTIQTALCYLCLLLSMAAIGGVEDSFNDRFDLLPRDIHLYESIYGILLPALFALGGSNMIWVVASTYPGLVIHKGLINLGSGKGWWYHGTDDATGATYNIPLLGIKIPRRSVRLRQVLAVLSLLAFGLSYALDWRITLWPIAFVF